MSSINTIKLTDGKMITDTYEGGNPYLYQERDKNPDLKLKSPIRVIGSLLHKVAFLQILEYDTVNP